MDAAGFQRREERLDRVKSAAHAAYKGRLLTYWRGAVKLRAVSPGARHSA